MLAPCIDTLTLIINSHMRFLSLINRFDAANLRLRVISSMILIPCVLLAVWLGGIAYGALITCASTIGFYEWIKLTTPTSTTRTMAVACGLLIIAMTIGVIFSVSSGALLGAIFTIAAYFVLRQSNDTSAALAAMGIPYMAGSGLSLIALRGTESGASFILYLLIAVWSTDIGAFVFGRIIGGAKLAPTISPSKTWAGLFGGMASSMLFGYIAAVLMDAPQAEIALILSPFLAAVSQAGDLFESYFKRRAGVKESGDLIPGHGGILDRIDGLVFAAVAAFLLQEAIGPTVLMW